MAARPRDQEQDQDRDQDRDQDPDRDQVLEDELDQALCVLAGSDPENCSYSRGYVKRQAVFACNTCTPSAADPAGVCLACANKCHDGHDIFELYTKRNFRCDCGNAAFRDFKCQLIPVKDEKNVRNLYNHNFNGCYCTCDRLYPDPDDQVNDEMIQCVVCEDWFHSRHLGCSSADPEELQEMVCESCMNKVPVLWTYAAHLAVPPVDGVTEVEVDVEDTAEKEKASEVDQNEPEEPSTSAESEKPEDVVERSPPSKRSHQEMTCGPAACRLKELQARGPQGPERRRAGAVFWPYSWRSQLCTCTSCKRVYVAADVPFLMDQSDTILAYENRGLDQPFGEHPLMALTSSMSRVQQLEVIYGFNELTTSMTAFLEQCEAEGKTVTVEAVHQFFEELRARKRQRTNAGFQ